MELINKKDAIHAVLHNQGDAAVAAVQAIKPINPHGELREMRIDEMIDKGEWQDEQRKEGNAMYNELIKALQTCARQTYCDNCPRYKDNDESAIACAERTLEDAADAIERLTDEVDRKDKAIQGLLTQIESKDKAIERMRDLMRHYKAAYRTAYKLYQEARNEQQP